MEISYFAIIQIDKINFDDLKTHIVECETLTEAKNFPLTEFIVIKKKLGARTNGTGFVYPHVFSYKVVDKNENPFLLSYKNNKCTNYLFETLRSGYSDDYGGCKISVLDRNNIIRTKGIGADHNISAIFIINILKFLFSFENEYGSNWNYYDIVNEKLEIIKELENENSELKEKVEQRNLKLKALRKRKINSKEKS